MLAERLAGLLNTLAAPYQLVRLCSQAQTRRTIGDAAEMLALQWYGGLTVVTEAAGGGQGSAEPTQPVLRSLIQLDGDVLLTVDRAWLERIEARAPDQLAQALARHDAAIATALQPLRQGLLTASDVLVLAGRSRWSVLGLGGLLQGGAITLAPGIGTAESIYAWLGAAAGQLEVVMLQGLSVLLFVTVGVVRLGLRWWIRGRLGNRMPALIDRLSKDALQAGRESARDAMAAG